MRKIGERHHNPKLPAFIRQDPEKNWPPGFTIDDLVYVGDDDRGPLPDDTIETLTSELTSPETSLRQILRPIIQQHSSLDTTDSVDVRLDTAVAIILGHPVKKGRKSDPDQERQTLEVAEECWLMVAKVTEPSYLGTIIAEVLTRNGVDLSDEERRRDSVKTIRRKVVREWDRLLTKVSRKNDEDVRRHKVDVDRIHESLVALGLLG